MNSARNKCLAVTLAILQFSGFSLAEKKDLITTKVPAQYAGAATSGVTQDVSSLAEWWNNFQDSELQLLIKRAVVADLDVRIARAKLRESRATLRNTQTSNQIPTMNVDGSYSRSKTSQQNPQIPKLSGATTLIPTTYGVYQAYFDASYEVDIFGGVRNQVKAARADAAASEEDLRNTLVSALAEVARDYVQLREYQEQLQVAKQNEASQLDTLNITQVRNKAGLVSDLDVANAAASVAATQSSIPSLESKIAQQIHAISVLLGENPADLESRTLAQRGLACAGCSRTGWSTFRVASAPAGHPGSRTQCRSCRCSCRCPGLQAVS